MIDELAFNNLNPSCAAIVTAYNDGGKPMRISIGDKVFFIKDVDTELKLSRALIDDWMLNEDVDTAIVPVERLREALLPRPPAQITFHIEMGFAIICEENPFGGGWQLVELEPGIDEPVDEPIQFDNLAACLAAAVAAIIDDGIAVTGVTIVGLGILDGEAAVAAGGEEHG